MNRIDESDHLLPLPSPTAAKSLATGLKPEDSSEITHSLVELAAANSSGDCKNIATTTENVLSRFDIPSGGKGESDAESPDPRFTIYDVYFHVQRLPNGASKTEVVKALTIALAIIMKDIAKTETEQSSVTPMEFAILHQALAVVVEVLMESFN